MIKIKKNITGALEDITNFALSHKNAKRHGVNRIIDIYSENAKIQSLMLGLVFLKCEVCFRSRSVFSRFLNLKILISLIIIYDYNIYVVKNYSKTYKTLSSNGI